ncbi:MAG: Gfo/Idh/MocA family oxidoreductase [Microcoleaceae cyanobacterium]
MTNLTKVAIFGAGRWGTHLIRNFHQHPQAEVVAIADPNPESLKTIKTRLQLSDEVCLATDWQQVLALDELDAVVIATPASTHYTIISQALQQGYHVLAEKPLTIKLSESQALCDLAVKHQRQLVIDHTYLFHPAVETGQQVIAKGKLGDLRYGYAARTHLEPVRPDVDALWDLAIHDIAIFNSWLGQTPVKVQATGTVWLQPQQQFETDNVEDFTPIYNTGLSDMVMATLTYNSGFQAFLHLCWLNQDKQRRLGVVGSEGTLIFDELSVDAPLTLQQGYLETVSQGWKGAGQKQDVITIPKQEPLAKVCDHFLYCVRQNIPSNRSDGYIATELVKILSGLSQSLQQNGRPIIL